jgi:hypothetical protein
VFDTLLGLFPGQVHEKGEGKRTSHVTCVCPN